MSRKNGSSGGCLAAFGVGILAALIMPTRFVLIVATIALVLAGISLIRCG